MLAISHVNSGLSEPPSRFEDDEENFNLTLQLLERQCVTPRWTWRIHHDFVAKAIPDFKIFKIEQ